MAEIERDLISMRTKEALAARKAAGVKLGRPQGTTSSKLDGKENEIAHLLGLGVSKASAARILGVAYGTLNSFIIRREIKPKAQPESA
jgi:DNA invertase Pin-like site-specific DNA recombinase